MIAKVREPLVRTVEVMGGMLFDMLKAPEEPPSSPSNQRLTHVMLTPSTKVIFAGTGSEEVSTNLDRLEGLC